jgi:tRNA(Arg) A34 adenosine deaminase TadA
VNKQQIIQSLLRANEVAKQALARGHHPFGAVLIAPDGETVLAEQGNIDTVNHAESTLARQAAQNYSSDYLKACTLVSTVEPCAMCAGTHYWANIGRLVYGMSEHQLLALTGSHADNPTLNLPCRTVFEAGQKPIEVIGPVPEIEPEIAALHRKFWSRP